MKKQIILIITLIVLLGATAGALLIVNHMENEQANAERQAEQEKILFELNSNDISRIEMDTADGVYIAKLNDVNQWVLENEVDFEINTYYLNSVASQLASLKADSVLEPVAEADLTVYGLDQPTSISLFADDNTYTIHVGKISSTNEFYYVTVDGRDNVFTVPAIYGDYLNPNKDSLKSIYILRNKDSEITEISLWKQDEPVYELVMNDRLWEMKSPIETTDMIDNSRISTLLTTINQMIVDRFGDEHVEEKDYASYGFDKPAYTFYFKQANGETTTLYALDYDVSAVSFITFICKETGQVFYMQSNYADFLQQLPENFIKKTIFNLNVSEIESLSVAWQEREDADILIDEENGKYTFNGTAVEEIGTEAVAALENFYSKVQSLRYEDMYINETPDTSKDTLASFTYTATDGTQTTLSFIQRDSDTCWIMMNDEYTGFILSKTVFTSRNGIYDYFDTLLKALNPEE